MSSLDTLRLHPKPPAKPTSAAPPNATLAVKQAFETSQYSGDMNPPSIPYASGAPPFSQPPVKTAGPPPSSDKSKLEKKGQMRDIDRAIMLGGALQGGLSNTDRESRPGGVTGGALGGAAGALAGWHGAAAMLPTVFRRLEPRTKGGKALALVGAGVPMLAAGVLGGAHLGGRAGSALLGGEKKVANLTSPQAQLTKSKSVGAPKTTAPPGPSIQQIAKPNGFGIPAPGATKTADVEKLALIERLVRLGATPIPKTPKLVMKLRSPTELKALQGAVEQGWDKRVTEPIMGKLRPLVNKLPEGKLRNAAGHVAKSVASDPVGMGLSAVAPVPGAELVYAGAKKGLEKGIDKLFPLPG
jgi:hypothetical protein